MTTKVRSEIGRYAIVPEWLLDTGVSAQAIRLYAVLAAKYADRETHEAKPGRERLSRDLNVSRDTIDRATAELESVKALTRERRVTAENVPTSSLYTLRVVAPEAAPVPTGSRMDAATGVAADAATGSRADAAGDSRADAAQNQNHLVNQNLDPDLSRATRAPASEIPTKPLTIKQIEREQHVFGKAAEEVWLAAARKVESPYITRDHLRKVHELAIDATRFASEQQVLDAIRRRLDAKSSPVRIPEWARLEAADRDAHDHRSRLGAQRDEIIEDHGQAAERPGLRPIGVSVTRILGALAP